MEELDSTSLIHLEGNIWQVPCILQSVGDFFQPLFQPSSISKAPQKSNTWTHTEDEILRRAVCNHSQYSWKLVAENFNSVVHNKQGGKTGKECRERWLNHLNPHTKKGQWTLHEDIIILTIQKEIGNKWKFISSKLQGRTQHSVKNRWLSLKIEAQTQWPNYSEVLDKLLAQKLAMNSIKESGDNS